MTCCCAEHAGAFEMLDRTCPNCPEHHSRGLNPDTLRRQADFLDGKGSESTADSLRQRAEIIELKAMLDEAYGLMKEAYGLIMTVDTKEKFTGFNWIKVPDIPDGWFTQTNDLLARIREVLWP